MVKAQLTEIERLREDMKVFAASVVGILVTVLADRLSNEDVVELAQAEGIFYE